MANAVTFWKGPKSLFDDKAGKYVAGRIYFVTDANNESLYLGESTDSVKLISPARLTALTDTIADADANKTATASAIVAYVKSAIENAFGAGSPYATKIKEIEDAIDAVEGRLDVVEPKLAGYGDDSDSYSTVKAHVDAVEAIASEAKSIASAAMTFKGVVDKYSAEEGDKDTTTYLPDVSSNGLENGDIYYVKDGDIEYVYIAAHTDSDGNPAPARWEALGGYVKADVYTKGETDSLLSGKVDASTYSGKVEDIEGRLDATEGVANGAAAAVATKVEQEAYNAKMGELDQSITDLNNNKVNKTTTINGETLDANVTLTGENINVSTADGAVTVKAAIDDRYTKAEVDDIVDGITGGNGSLASKMDKVDAGNVGQVITADANGNAVASGYTLGGAELGETASDKVLATEKAVNDAIAAAVLVWEDESTSAEDSTSTEA